ncbi:CDP-diacylglycerol--glycerol-3-phosphate 3-phosphatidyltransferase [Actinorhabdospora filicis]|uniref:CDP-diacylglycerol--glycerol-3-phosphate 3-phosphatidyltransferase n=1 Tax=Actinorhabdospora filicis TaxID=1785913 RepID=A0A9W6SNP2_9ACTN|nr:CDP-alcohol phosphatidyltransferase family protein [Actinorhabdospora filicis]GLZ79209.1 CDP-diacylglycerol--glycerol-3-phosphate 3-phosphatidyltransferase [Actinorhabdospora filicis]
MTGTEQDAPPWRIWTIPNAVSFIRFLGIGVFLYLLLGPRNDVAGLIVLAVGGGTDWVDGFLARRLGQVSRFGQLFDPLVDRLYILAAIAALTIREFVPWQFTAALLARELVLLAGLFVLRRHGYGPLEVHYLGKAATFIIFAAFPVLVLAGQGGTATDIGKPVGWALAWWGIVLYWLSALLYVVQVAGLARAARARNTPDVVGHRT